MKHIKSYEAIESIGDNYPQSGMYAISDTRSQNRDLISFLNNNIGIITYLEDYSVRIEYENIPKNVKNFFDDKERTCDLELLKYYSKNKEELELKISANKFNL